MYDVKIRTEGYNTNAYIFEGNIFATISERDLCSWENGEKVKSEPIVLLTVRQTKEKFEPGVEKEKDWLKDEENFTGQEFHLIFKKKESVKVLRDWAEAMIKFFERMEERDAKNEGNT